ncbi:MAG TPA: AI-2E family transporter [Microbacteriaceae bacterium]|nr:AI-2E family transporter [Microbacteriaceae bacterium]
MWRKRNQQHTTFEEVKEKAARLDKPRRLWSDSFGVLATRSLQLIIIVVLLTGIMFGLHFVTLVVIPVLLALILASAFAPVMHWFRKHRFPSALATVIVLALIAATFTGVIWLIVWAIQDQFDELSEKATEGFDQVISWTLNLPFAPDQQQINEWQDEIINFFTSASFGSGALAGVSAVTSFFTGLVLLLVILFFFLKDGPKIWLFLIRPFEGEGRERALRVGDKTVDTLGNYVRGTAAIAAVDAVGIGVGLWIFQVPLALPLSVLVFFLSFIPLVGATLAGTLAALVALVSNGPINAIIIVAVVIVVNQLEGNFLQPVLMGRALKLHALVILVALSVGTLLAGVLGAVLAVPLTAVAWGILQVWDGPDLPIKWARKHPEEP